MIQLTRLNNQPLIVNSDLIKLVENTPDTVLTLVTGEKIVVLESSKQVVDKIVDFRRRVLTDLSVQDVSSSSQTSRLTRQLFPVEKS
ncbi:MAG TPA: flagellar FlbD family protein [Candidatus Acidoferrales bacterium]|jgi:flagellar protein FlbD|nr:flagellar FlbD family protein [Candidatus Acidoferrales bacterium]